MAVKSPNSSDARWMTSPGPLCGEVAAVNQVVLPGGLAGESGLVQRGKDLFLTEIACHFKRLDALGGGIPFHARHVGQRIVHTRHAFIAAEMHAAHFERFYLAALLAAVRDNLDRRIAGGSEVTGCHDRIDGLLSL